jgi:hypothetical protein
MSGDAAGDIAGDAAELGDAACDGTLDALVVAAVDGFAVAAEVAAVDGRDVAAVLGRVVAPPPPPPQAASNNAVAKPTAIRVETINILLKGWSSARIPAHGH